MSKASNRPRHRLRRHQERQAKLPATDRGRLGARRRESFNSRLEDLPFNDAEIVVRAPKTDLAETAADEFGAVIAA
jgi:hypothetical protein